MANDSIAGTITRSRDELDQSSLSARLLEPFTRQLFADAGLRPGMRVLDVFSGAGDVALLARDVVGPDGHVTGFDQSAEPVAFATERVAFRGIGNMEFVEAPIEDLPFDAEFDAIVGRIVLAYRRDPVRDLRALLRCLRPGGLLVFQEFDHLAGRTIPPVPMVEEVREWLVSAFERAGKEPQMGVKLYAAFEAAGLPGPRMRLDGIIGGAASLAPILLANVVRTMLPQLDALGIVTSDEVQVETIEERIRLDLMRTGAIMQTPLLIGAWTQVPS